nr:hypothetical protein [Tanacetum cinerariifolium]
MKTIIKEQVQAQVSKIMQKIENSSFTLRIQLKKILIDKMKENQSVNISDIQKNLYNALVESYNSNKDIFSSYGDVVTLKRGRNDQDKDEDPFVGSNQGSKRRRSDKEAKSSKEQIHKESKLKINNLTLEVLTGPTYDLIKGTYKSVVELEYHLEEVFKDTNDSLDWHNPEGKPYPYDLSKPLPLIQNKRSRQVIPWDYFINYDLKYLKDGSLSYKYTIVTKTKATDYGQVKWIEDKVKENQEKDKNRIKTGQKREAWRSQEKFKAVAVERGSKNEENKKRMVENPYT